MRAGIIASMHKLAAPGGGSLSVAHTGTTNIGGGVYSGTATIPLGAPDSTRTIVVVASVRWNGTVGTVSATLDGQAMTLDYSAAAGELTIYAFRIAKPSGSTGDLVVTPAGGVFRVDSSVANSYALTGSAVALVATGSVVDGNGTSELTANSTPGGVAIAGLHYGVDWPDAAAWSGLTGNGTTLRSLSHSSACGPTTGASTTATATYGNYGSDVALIVTYA